MPECPEEDGCNNGESGRNAPSIAVSGCLNAEACMHGENCCEISVDPRVTEYERAHVRRGDEEDNQGRDQEQLCDRELEPGEGILLEAFDEAFDSFQPGQLQVPRCEERVLPVSLLLETFTQRDVVENFHPQRFMPADAVIGGAADEVEGADADIDIFRRAGNRPGPGPES